MAIFNKSKIKTAEVFKALDTAVSTSSGLAEFIGCIVCIAIGSLLGTSIPVPTSGGTTSADTDDVEG